MPSITPSLGFPVRTTPLTGEELLIKQNPISDSTPDPKEEMVTTELILDYVLDNLSGISAVTGGTISGDSLILGLADGTTIDIDISDLNNDTYVISAAISGNNMVFTNNVGGTFSVNISTLINPLETIGGLSVGSSTIKYRGLGVTAAISSGHITITVASGGYIEEISGFIENADMTYTDTLSPNAGLRITINNSANSSTHTLIRPVRVWKKALSGPISTTNPGQAQNPLDINEMLYSNTNGIFSIAWNDLAANSPNGIAFAM